MGADFMCSICPLPPNITEDVILEIEERVSNLSPKIVKELLHNFHHDWEESVRERIEGLGEEHLFEVNQISCFFEKEIATEMIKDSLKEVIYSDSRRDVEEVFLENKLWLVSGGMSWGESPTEAMNSIEILSFSEVLNDLNNV